jgi:hypothetical protein
VNFKTSLEAASKRLYVYVEHIVERIHYCPAGPDRNLPKLLSTSSCQRLRIRRKKEIFLIRQSSYLTLTTSIILIQVLTTHYLEMGREPKLSQKHGLMVANEGR